MTRRRQIGGHRVATLASVLTALLVCGCGDAVENDMSARDDDSRAIDARLDFQPNILWLVAEDLGPWLPAFGDSTIATPNLSRLAAEGVRYTHVFSPSGVCAPSRAAIATGMYPTAIGAMHMRTGPWYSGAVPQSVIESAAEGMPVEPYEAVPPPEVRMHAEYLRHLGYYTSNNRKEDYQFLAPVTAWDENSTQAHWRDRAPGQPFFSIFNFNVTHESRIWAKADDPLLVSETLDVPVPPYLPDTEVLRRDLRRMYSNILEMDAQVGAILDQLEADGLADSTIVFWYGDHGGPMPRQKRTLYDSGLRVPMIIRFPDGRDAGMVDDRLVSFVDFLPTLVSLAGAEPPGYLNGRAFLGPFAESEDREFIHAAADRFDCCYDTIRAVRDGRYKYIRNFSPNQSHYMHVQYRLQMPTMQELLRLRDAGELDAAEAQWFRPEKSEEELFDTESDPHEMNNLAGDPEHADALARLRAEYERWAAAVPDYGLMPEAEFRSSIWPDGVQPATAEPVASWSGDELALSSNTDGASIGYQVLAPGGEPGQRWEVYVEPFTLPPDARVVAVAHRIGYRPSGEVVLEQN